MQQRFLATTVLTAALLFSLGGNFLTAALCPHLRSTQAACEPHAAEPAMSHEGMGDMHVESMEEPVSNPDLNAIALGQPIQPCSHCAAHSRTTPNAVSQREIEASKRSGNIAIPDAVPTVVSVNPLSVAVVTSRAHGPPGTAIPRHILINIYRI